MIIPHDAFIDDRVSVCGLLANMELAAGGDGAILSSEANSAGGFPGMSLRGISLSGISGHRLYMSIDAPPPSTPCSD